MHPNATHLSLSYDEGDFTYSPMVTSHEHAHERAAKIAVAGMENVTLTHYRMKGKKRVIVATETVAVTGHPAGDGLLLMWSTVAN